MFDMSGNSVVNPENKYSILGIEDQYFGVDIVYIREVIPSPKITKMPNVNPAIIGVFNLRGQIYSIIDYRNILGMEYTPVDSKNLVELLE